MPPSRKMHLAAYLKAGPAASYPCTWRHPAATLDDLFEPERWEQIARVLEAACFFADGLGIPATFEEFGRMVVPELKRRGLFRTAYAGRTLRENLRNPG